MYGLVYYTLVSDNRFYFIYSLYMNTFKSLDVTIFSRNLIYWENVMILFIL